MLRFVNRKHELGSLERFYQAPDAGLLIMLGRRRAGKTRLWSHFLEKQGISGGTARCGGSQPKREKTADWRSEVGQGHHQPAGADGSGKAQPMDAPGGNRMVR